MKLLIDMNLSFEWVELFAIHGIAAVHWSSVGHAKAADPEIVQYAADHEFQIITRDKDFAELVITKRSKVPSIIQLRTGRASVDVIGSRIVQLLRQCELELHSGTILTINLEHYRLRSLSLLDF